MSSFEVSTCFGCGAGIAPGPGNYYCAECVAEQTKAHEAERQAFDDFHAFADACAKHSESTMPDALKGTS